MYVSVLPISRSKKYHNKILPFKKTIQLLALFSWDANNLRVDSKDITAVVTLSRINERMNT